MSGVGSAAANTVDVDRARANTMWVFIVELVTFLD
jgi:hypothetical protein